MDTSTLFQIFNASFDSDPNTRIAAELELRKLEAAEGLIPTLLQLVSPASTESAVVRLAAAIYLKNRISSSWRQPTKDSIANVGKGYVAIAPSDRQSLKTNLLSLLAALAADAGSQQVKAQVAAVLSKVVDNDFPDNWPGLMDEIVVLLGGSEGQVEAGLRATVEVFACLRYSRKDADGQLNNSLVANLFPILHDLAQKIFASQPADPASLTLQGTLLRLVLKAYKNSISHSLTEAHQARESIIPWGTLLLQIVQRPIAPELLPEDVDDREKHPWSKSKKWAAYSLNRLFNRYGNPSQLPSNMVKQYKPFADRFIAQFAPEIHKAYLGLVARAVEGEWQAKKVSYYVINFFDDCVKPKETWKLLKPHVQTLLERFIFPFICLSEEEIEMFTDDGQEFAKSHFGDFISDTYLTPQASSLTFISTLVELRKKFALPLVLNFIQTLVSKYPAEVTPRQKDGALRLLAAVAPSATKSKSIGPSLEPFFLSYVVPEFKSPHGFLRYRACEVVEKFESHDMKWEKKENLNNTLRAIMDAITDPELPVRIQAAIALPELVRYDEVRASMVPNIGRIMQELLKLSAEVDLDAITNTTRSMVSEFSEEVIPFAAELTASLIQSYQRLLQETVEAREKEAGGGEPDYDDEKTLVKMNLLRTLDQIVSSLQDNLPMLAQLEAIIAPVMVATLQHNVLEVADEIFELADSLTFFQKRISSHMWPVFEATYAALKDDGIDYVHEAFGLIDNCISFGAEQLSASEEYRRMLLDLFDTILTSQQMGAEDRVVGCKLGEALFLNLRGHIDEALPLCLDRAMSCVMNKNEDPEFVVTNNLYLHALELVIVVTLYNPQLALAYLDGHDWTQSFFAHWFKSIPKLTRVHDKKMSVAAICVILEWLAHAGNAPLAQSAGQLVAGALEVFKDFPEALKHRKDQEDAFADDDGEDDDDDDDLEFETFGDDDDDEEGEEGDVRESWQQQMDELTAAREAREARIAAGEVVEDDEDDNRSSWSDEILWASPLDQIDAYVRFSTVLAGLEQTTPQLFALATQGLTPAQQGELQAIAARAQRGGEKAPEDQVAAQ